MPTHEHEQNAEISFSEFSRISAFSNGVSAEKYYSSLKITFALKQTSLYSFNFNNFVAALDSSMSSEIHVYKNFNLLLILSGA